MKNNDEIWGFIYIVVALFAAYYFATHVGIDATLPEAEHREQVIRLMLSPIAFISFSIVGVLNIRFRKQF
jgi:hypothetical protein